MRKPRAPRPRTRKKDYTALYDNPEALLGDGIRVFLDFANLCIRIQDTKTWSSFVVRCSKGRAGFSAYVQAEGQSPAQRFASVRVLDYLNHESAAAEGIRGVSATLYDNTDYARAFSRWYDHKETPEDVALLGPQYDRKEKNSDDF